MPTTRRRLTFAGLTFVLVVVLLEGLLRVVMAVGPFTFHYLDYKTDEWHVDDNPHWGVWHLPDAETTHVKSCVEATYRTNAFGMRDQPRREQKEGPRIAVLGDSFVEGYLVEDDETMTRVLQDEVFGGRVEVLNFGTSGFFGTTQEWLVYEHLARKFSPDVVVLAFLNENDLFDCSWRYWQQQDPRRRPYLVPSEAEAGSFELFYPDVEARRARPGRWVENQLMRYSYVARLANEVSLRLKYAGRPPKALEVYAATPNELVSGAWAVVEEALTRLSAATRRDGAELVIVQLVDPAQIDPARADAIRRFEGHDPLVPNRRLAALTARLGIRTHALHDDFVVYRDEEGLAPPYFSMTCDGHWAPIGHSLAAKSIGRFLVAEGLVSGP